MGEGTRGARKENARAEDRPGMALMVSFAYHIDPDLSSPRCAQRNRARVALRAIAGGRQRLQSNRESPHSGAVTSAAPGLNVASVERQ